MDKTKAAIWLEEAQKYLMAAKSELSQQRSGQVIRLANVISEVEEIHGIITDPECEG